LRPALSKNMRPYLKITNQQKRAGGIDKVIEHLLHMSEVLSSNSSVHPKKRKKIWKKLLKSNYQNTDRLE
jgi:hypothetical protein